ncbi:ornithine cyclodeaminase family protein, partial [Burkholderia multivorans]
IVTMKQVSTGEVTLDADRTLIFKGSGMSWEDLAVAAKLFETVDRGER